jgi:hypothetical protein
VRKIAKLTLLAATIVPILYFGAFIVVVLRTVLTPSESVLTEGRFAYLVIDHLGIMLLLTALFGYYCLLLYRESTLDLAKKIIWIAALLVTGPFAMLVFWYVQVWKQPLVPNRKELLATGETGTCPS